MKCRGANEQLLVNTKIIVTKENLVRTSLLVRKMWLTCTNSNNLRLRWGFNGSHNINNVSHFFHINTKTKTLLCRSIYPVEFGKKWSFVRICCKIIEIWDLSNLTIFWKCLLQGKPLVSWLTFVCKIWQVWGPMFSWVCIGL